MHLPSSQFGQHFTPTRNNRSQTYSFVYFNLYVSKQKRKSVRGINQMVANTRS